jgi:hypothetical protein
MVSRWGSNLFPLPIGLGRRYPIRLGYISDNQFILQSAKIESKLHVCRKRIKEKGAEKKRRRFSNTTALCAGLRRFSLEITGIDS